MKKSYILVVVFIILAGTKFSYNNGPKYRIKEFYNVIDTQQDINKYNKLVIETKKLSNMNNIPDIVKKRDIIELKKLNIDEYPILKKDLNYKHEDKKESIQYYMIKYNIEFKTGVPTPVDSGIYYEVIKIVKYKNKWLVDPNTHKASFHNGKLIIDS